MAPAILSTIEHLLVRHPAVSNFHWRKHHTIGASPSFLAAAVILYLTLTFLLHRRILPIPRPSPPLLRLLSFAHNLILILLSLAMSLGCSLSALRQMPSSSWIFCFPQSPPTPPRGPVFFWAQVFYMSKIYEFLDTFLIILACDAGGGSGGRSRLTFLHVYHHAVVVVMCYVWLATAQSLLPVALVTNASVHVLMYSYYLCSGLGWRWSPRWKRVVTNCQILQFGFSFLISLVFLWYHFTGSGCSGMEGWVFNAVFNASLLALFVDFHSKNYKSAAGKRKEKVGPAERKKR